MSFDSFRIPKFERSSMKNFSNSELLQFTKEAKNTVTILRSQLEIESLNLAEFIQECEERGIRHDFSS